MSNVSYASVIGSLLCVMLYTRLDICFVVGLVRHYQINPRPGHWQAIKSIMDYLRGTANLVLCY